MSVEDDFYALSSEQKRWVMDKLYEYRKNVSYAFALSDPTEQAKAQEELKAYLIQRVKAQQEINGSEKWHDALTRYAELEKRVAEIEKILKSILHPGPGSRNI